MHGTTNVDETITRLADRLREHFEDKAYREGLQLFQHFAEQVALKRRKFNTQVNETPDDMADAERKRQEAEAEAYRRKSKG